MVKILDKTQQKTILDKLKEYIDSNDIHVSTDLFNQITIGSDGGVYYRLVADEIITEKDYATHEEIVDLFKEVT